MAEEGEREEAGKSEIICPIWCFLVNLPGVPTPGAAVAGSGTLWPLSSLPPACSAPSRAVMPKPGHWS